MSPLFIFTQSPNSNTQAREGVEAVLACAAFDQTPAVMFIDQGVLQLLPQADKVGRKNLNKMVQALEIYGVESIYVCADSLVRFGVAPTELKPEGQLISLSERSLIIQQAAWVACF
ncbi:MAG: sulfurtransferase complex subunit TusC [Moraxellaceae bacterium]|nr:MAG: sulfurtransferase complex subunit TusC [Moraxellaceae bacterium]